MDKKHVTEFLEKNVAAKVVANAKNNAAQAGHAASFDLIRSIKVQRTAKGVRIEMLGYGDVLDKGLSGWDFQRDTPYRATSGLAMLRDGYVLARFGKGRVPVSWTGIRRWVELKGIAFSGKSPDQTATLITNSIKRKGYEGTKWFTRAKQESMKDPVTVKGVFRAFGQDIKERFKGIKKRI